MQWNSRGTKPYTDWKDNQDESSGEYQVAEVMYDTIYVQTYIAILVIFYQYIYMQLQVQEKSMHRHIMSQMKNSIYH